MIISKKMRFLSIVSLVFLLIGCDKKSETPAQVSTGFKCKTLTYYYGNDFANLDKFEVRQFNYNTLGNLVSVVQTFYSGKDTMVHNFDYTYSGNVVIENDIMIYQKQVIPIQKRWIILNSDNLLEKDSLLDFTNGRTVVKKRLYLNKHTVNSYISDTVDGFRFTWNGNNQIDQYIKSTAFDQLIWTNHYGTKKNTIDLGDFWENGLKSENLVESADEPHYGHFYTYKIESDGFVSEMLMSQTDGQTGSAPTYWEKTIYTR